MIGVIKLLRGVQHVRGIVQPYLDPVAHLLLEVALAQDRHFTEKRCEHHAQKAERSRKVQLHLVKTAPAYCACLLPLPTAPHFNTSASFSSSAGPLRFLANTLPSRSTSTV